MGFFVLYSNKMPKEKKITSKSVSHENLLHVKNSDLGTKGKLRQGG